MLCSTFKNNFNISAILLQVVIHLFKVKHKNTRKQCEICPKLTKTDTRTTSIDMNTHLVDVILIKPFTTFCCYQVLQRAPS